MSALVVVDRPGDRIAFWANQISADWRQVTEGIIQTGRDLIAAKADLRHGEFTEMVKVLLPFSLSTAERLMAIARHPVISNPAHGHILPSSWRTLYELTKLSDTVLEANIADGTINPQFERKGVSAIIHEEGTKPAEKATPPPPAGPTKLNGADFVELAERINELEAELEKAHAIIWKLQTRIKELEGNH